MEATCYDGVCYRCRASKVILFGIVLFVATWYAQQQNNVYLIWYVLAVVLFIKGLVKLATPNCPHCAPSKAKR